MTTVEIKAAAQEQITAINNILVGQDVTINVPSNKVPNDDRAQQLISMSNNIITKGGRQMHPRRLARIRELLTRYVAV